MKILETQYKGGYQVKEGGDYLVRPAREREATEHWHEFAVVRVATGEVVGMYGSRTSANRRAQQLTSPNPAEQQLGFQSRKGLAKILREIRRKQVLASLARRSAK